MTTRPRTRVFARALTIACLTAPGIGALAPGAAPAATLTRAPDGTLVYVAAPGTVSHVDVQSIDPPTVQFYTSGDPMTIWPSGCSPDDLFGPEVVTCPAAPAVRVDLGDRDDIGRVSDTATAPVTIAGGDGADLLTGSPNPDTLDGGPGDDTIEAGDGADTLLGGDGADELSGMGGADHLDGGAGDDHLHPDGMEAPAADVVDGGPGIDTLDLDYTSRFTSDHPPVLLTLGGGADDGRPGEGDDVHGVERVDLNVGGRFVGTDGPETIRLHQVGAASELDGLGGDDVLQGGDGPDQLDGGPGADTLDGGYGDDVIVGGPGRDAISADLAGGDCGPLWCKFPYGNDVVQARDGEVDSITCGAGTDRVVADASDIVSSDCETVDRGTATTPGGAKPSLAAAGSTRLGKALRNGLVIRLRGMRAGTVKVQARLGRKVVASARVTVGARGSATVRLRFARSARIALAKRAAVRLTVKAGGVSRTIRLRRSASPRARTSLQAVAKTTQQAGEHWS